MQTSIKDLKNNLSAYLKKVRLGEELIITSHHHMIAKIVPLTGEESVTKIEQSNFMAEIHQLHHQLQNIKLKVNMRDTVLQQREQERN